MAGTLPRRMDMMSPYCLAKFWRVRWGRLPSMWRFPIMGSGRGPGGSFWCFDFEEAEMSDQRHARRTRRMAIIVGGLIVSGFLICV